VYDVLVEQQDENGDWIGRSQYQAPQIDSVVHIQGGENLMPGQMVRVRITQVEEYDWMGVLEP
jgi:ribosomal protein S12 methylthiotransferase